MWKWVLPYVCVYPRKMCLLGRSADNNCLCNCICEMGKYDRSERLKHDSHYHPVWPLHFTPNVTHIAAVFSLQHTPFEHTLHSTFKKTENIACSTAYSKLCIKHLNCIPFCHALFMRTTQTIHRRRQNVILLPAFVVLHGVPNNNYKCIFGISQEC